MGTGDVSGRNQPDDRALTSMDQLLENPAEALNEHLRECAREASAQAQLLPSGQLRDVLLEKVRQYEAQIWMNALLEAKPNSQPKQRLSASS